MMRFSALLKLLVVAGIGFSFLVCLPAHAAAADVLIFVDDFSTNTGRWILTGNHLPVRTSGYMEMTDLGGSESAVMWFDTQIVSSFNITFDFWAGGGSGADGFCFMFFKQTGYTPSTGGGLGFIDNGGNPVPGYGIEFDNWNNGAPNDPSANHIALINNTVWNHLAYENDARTEDSTWHTVWIAVTPTSVAVSVDVQNPPVISWTGVFSILYGGLGFGAGTGGSTNYHRIDNVALYLPDYVVVVPGGGSQSTQQVATQGTTQAATSPDATGNLLASTMVLGTAAFLLVAIWRRRRDEE